MDISLKETVIEMVESLEQAADDFDVSLKGINRNNFNEELDGRFEDGGEVRCERFTDVAIDYGCQYGELESDPFREAQFEAIDGAFDIIEKKYK